MKVTISKDEWWPMYSLDKLEEGENPRFYPAIEVPDELFYKYSQLIETFWTMQNALAEYWRQTKL